MIWIWILDPDQNSNSNSCKRSGWKLVEGKNIAYGICQYTSVGQGGGMHSTECPVMFLFCFVLKQSQLVGSESWVFDVAVVSQRPGPENRGQIRVRV